MSVAYSTFTILRFMQQHVIAELIQYDNPHVILLRDGQELRISPYRYEYRRQGDLLHRASPCSENDIFIAMSDGCHPRRRRHVAELRLGARGYHQVYGAVSQTSVLPPKRWHTILLDECNKLYDGHQPGDDTTVSVIVRMPAAVQPMNLLIGPPSNPADDCTKMMSTVLFQRGQAHRLRRHDFIHCRANFCTKRCMPSLAYLDPEIPPIAAH